MLGYKLGDVFNEAQVPGVTFVEPKEFGHIVSALDTPGKHVTVCGPSGCGKTTLVVKAVQRLGVPHSDLFLINARAYPNFDDGAAVFAQALRCEPDWEPVEDLLSLVRYVVMDDFHHFTAAARSSIGARLKLWHEKGIRAIVIGISRTAAELVSADPELSIRNDPVELRTQDDEFVSRLITLGETALNVRFDNELRGDIVKAAGGFPSVAQVICRVACVTAGAQETQAEEVAIRCSLPEVKGEVLTMYHPRFFDRVVGLAKGKQQARSVHNTYFDIIGCIAAYHGSEVPTEYLHDRIVRTVVDPTERSRKSTSYYNCLKYLGSVIEEKGLSDVIEFDHGSGTIYILDPAFRFYLSLLEMEDVRKLLHVKAQTYPYDVAVSFAGSQRDYVLQAVQAMKERGLQVFYDFDEQARLWGKNLRQELARVYANDAEYMVVFVSVDYPEKDWPSFELEVGREAQHKRTQEYLLPVRMDDVHVVGLSEDVCYLDGRTSSPEEIAELMAQKNDPEGHQLPA